MTFYANSLEGIDTQAKAFLIELRQAIRLDTGTVCATGPGSDWEALE
jgi:hypothetical protein